MSEHSLETSSSLLRFLPLDCPLSPSSAVAYGFSFLCDYCSKLM